MNPTPNPDNDDRSAPGSPRDDTAAPPPPASLRRELLAILALYAILSVLPLLIGSCAG